MKEIDNIKNWINCVSHGTDHINRKRDKERAFKLLDELAEKISWKDTDTKQPTESGRYLCESYWDTGNILEVVTWNNKYKCWIGIHGVLKWRHIINLPEEK